MKNINTENYNWLAPEHRPDGVRSKHDDWMWPLSCIPRTWTTTRCYRPPLQLFGSQSTYIRFSDGALLDVVEKNNILLKSKNELGEDYFAYPLSLKVIQNGIKNKEIGPTPIPTLGRWQFSLVFTGYYKLPILYIAYRSKNGFYIAIGARWTNPVLGNDPKIQSIQFPSFGFRMIK